MISQSALGQGICYTPRNWLLLNSYLSNRRHPWGIHVGRTLYSTSLWLGASIRRWPAVHMKMERATIPYLVYLSYVWLEQWLLTKVHSIPQYTVPLFRWPVTAANLRRDCTDSSNLKRFNTVYGLLLKKKKKKQDDVPRPRWGRTLGPWYVSLRINHWHKELWQLLEGWINFVMFDIHGPCCVMSLFSLFRFKLLNWTVAPSYRAHKPNAIKKIHTTGALGTCHLIQLNITHSPPCN